ncbi:UDP-N-acetylmuramoyl-tripeptide--D-alanyl-D-alanine ligase [bacterium]|nr:UDP-N-acetylmuramoyl-tripeptide--D-alanyl-D-alanine ligase [bacterium]
MKSFFKKIIAAILKAEARLVLFRHKPKIVAVIGTVGKTGTKDAIYTALSHKFFVRKSEKSFNSDIGVPLTVLGLPNGWGNVFTWIRNIFIGVKNIVWRSSYPEILVLELGVDRPGDMSALSGWIRPDILVITRFGDIPAHVEFFETPEAVIREKSLMIGSLKKDGVLVLNADDPKVLAKKDEWQGETLTFGFSKEADILLQNFSFLLKNDEDETRTSGISFEAVSGGETARVQIFGTAGKGTMHSVGAAIAVALRENVDIHEAARSFENFSPPNSRLRLIHGVKRTTIIDDTYNSSPAAAELALETLSGFDAEGQRQRRKIAVLGDMLELGKHTKEEHRKIGLLAGGICDILITVGIRARNIAEGALDAKMSEENIYQFDSGSEAGKFLQNILLPGDLVLVKGSQGMRMERIVEEVMQNPENKSELLVRQGEEWKRR